MSSDENKIRASTDTTNSGSRPPIPSACASLKDKDNFNTDTASNTDATDVPQYKYPQ
ncbi:hypothetical protein SAMD00023353_5600610 [Rosellinia necatrix]|uniref:Uncharacterized protein n=1 Tax=Rosellinia necatrix TaxID=77044 RepID=A0A1S8AA68_ROSNE|nr:hypothetical protein SAMD00023353_5600610 [Rosellinia necatrix]